MKKCRLKKISLSFFIIISFILIIVQLISSAGTELGKKQHKPFDPGYIQEDSLKIHPDSLWDRSEFTNTYTNER